MDMRFHLIKGKRDQLMEDEMGGARGHIGDMRYPYKILVGKPEGRRPLRRSRRRWNGS